MAGFEDAIPTLLRGRVVGGRGTGVDVKEVRDVP